MRLINPCFEQNIGRRRVFWTTRPDSCGSYNQCGETCMLPGLEYVDSEAVYIDQATMPPDAPSKDVEWQEGYRSIKNDNWLQSLILNILNTRARSDLKCPSPAAVYGHWSESYRNDALYIGSTMWNAASKAYIRTNDGVNAIEAAIKADMGKLIALGVADSVEVDAQYRGQNRVEVVITAIVTNTRHVLNLSGVMAQGTWVWQ